MIFRVQSMKVYIIWALLHFVDFGPFKVEIPGGKIATYNQVRFEHLIFKQFHMYKHYAYNLHIIWGLLLLVYFVLFFL